MEDEIIIIDYPALLTDKIITEEKRRQIKKLNEWLINFVRVNNITITLGEDESN